MIKIFLKILVSSSWILFLALNSCGADTKVPVIDATVEIIEISHPGKDSNQILIKSLGEIGDSLLFPNVNGDVIHVYDKQEKKFTDTLTGYLDADFEPSGSDSRSLKPLIVSLCDREDVPVLLRIVSTVSDGFKIDRRYYLTEMLGGTIDDFVQISEGKALLLYIDHYKASRSGIFLCDIQNFSSRRVVDSIGATKFVWNEGRQSIYYCNKQGEIIEKNLRTLEESPLAPQSNKPAATNLYKLSSNILLLEGVRGNLAFLFLDTMHLSPIEGKSWMVIFSEENKGVIAFEGESKNFFFFDRKANRHPLGQINVPLALAYFDLKYLIFTRENRGREKNRR